jgi:hypothetical protein
MQELANCSHLTLLLQHLLRPSPSPISSLCCRPSRCASRDVASNQVAHHNQACCSTIYKCDHILSVSIAAGSDKVFGLDLVQASFPSSSTLELKGVSTTAQFYGAGEQLSLTSSICSFEFSLMRIFSLLAQSSARLLRCVSNHSLCACIRVIDMAAGLTRMQVCTSWYNSAHPVLDKNQSTSKCKELIHNLLSSRCQSGIDFHADLCQWLGRRRVRGQQRRVAERA